MYTNTKIVYTSLLLLALVAIATPARLRADQQEFLEVGVCDQESCTGNRHCSEGGKCVCKDGFTGPQCERETCKCNPLGGSCDASGKCVCEQGFKGEYKSRSRRGRLARGGEVRHLVMWIEESRRSDFEEYL